MGSFTFLGCCGFLLSLFGHDRAKNDSRIEFPVKVVYYLNCHLGCSVVFYFIPQSYELLVLLCVCSGWSLDYVGVGMKAWYA